MAAERALAPPARSLKLTAIGTAAGLFSGLFGVGGGTVIVPLNAYMTLLYPYQSMRFFCQRRSFDHAKRFDRTALPLPS